MSITCTRRTIQIAMLGLALCASAPAFAHTTVKSQATEGVRDDNALRIGHGCENHPVTQQSAVFPGEAPELSASDPTVTIGDLGEVVTPATLVGAVAGIQDRSIFESQGEHTDPLGNVVGIYGKRGKLTVELAGRVPFQFTAPRFVAESCAVRLRIQIAIADVCKTQSPRLQPSKVNLWIPDNGSHYAVEGAASGVEGIGEPAVLTVNRNFATNPLPPACGAGFEVTVTPSAAQIERDLPIPGGWR